MLRTYLDHNATTALRPEARAAVDAAFDAGALNPSSLHDAGRGARRILDRARDQVARFAAADPDEVIFTASATESNHVAILGVVGHGGARRRIVSTAFEHPSVGALLDHLETRGFEVIRVRPDRDGVVDARDVLDAADPVRTLLVSVMLANHEVGTLQPVAAIGAALAGSGVLLHTDATQAAGWEPIGPGRLAADLVTFSGHKIGAPHGAGVLLARRGTTLSPIAWGGRQENGRRPGTENVAALAGLGAVVEALDRDRETRSAAVRALRDHLETRIVAAIPGVETIGASARRVPGTSSLHIPGAEAEALVIGCDLEGFAVSAGAACSSGTLRRSPTLVAMGRADAAESTLRVGLAASNTPADVDRFVESLARVAARARSAAPVAAGRA